MRRQQREWSVEFLSSPAPSLAEFDRGFARLRGGSNWAAGKRILSGLTIAVAAFAGARAADLPTRKAAPAEDYVRIYGVNGIAGFVIPGSDTCLRLFGDVKFETIGASTTTGYIYGRLFNTVTDAAGLRRVRSISLRPSTRPRRATVSN